MRKLFESAGITQTDIATLLGYSRISVHKWLAGKSDPRHAASVKLERLASLVKTAQKLGLLAKDTLPHPRLKEERRLTLVRILKKAKAA